MSVKKTGSILLKVVLGIVIVAVVLGGIGMAYRMGTMRSGAMFQTYGTLERYDADCPMLDEDGDNDESAATDNETDEDRDNDDRYYGGMMGGRGSMMGERGYRGFGMMPFGHGFFPLGGLFGGLLFIALILLVIRLLVGGSRWGRHFHGWGPHPMHPEECPYCQNHDGHGHHHQHETKQGDEFGEPELNIDKE